MQQGWQGRLLPHHSPTTSALLCSLRKPQLPQEKLLHEEGKPAVPSPRSAGSSPVCRQMAAHLHPSSPQPLVAIAVTQFCSGS